MGAPGALVDLGLDVERGDAVVHRHEPSVRVRVRVRLRVRYGLGMG